MTPGSYALPIPSDPFMTSANSIAPRLSFSVWEMASKIISVELMQEAHAYTQLSLQTLSQDVALTTPPLSHTSKLSFQPAMRPLGLADPSRLRLEHTWKLPE